MCATPVAISFVELCELEPGLLSLYNEAQAVRDSAQPSFCANRVWKGFDKQDGGFSSKLFGLVGCGARKDGDPRLRTAAAWDAAHNKIYGALPDCRNCVCVGFHDYIQDVLASREPN